jgi:DSF synthase
MTNLAHNFSRTVSNVTNVRIPPQIRTFNEENWAFEQLECRYDPDLHLMKYLMNATPRPNFSGTLLRSIQRFYARVESACSSTEEMEQYLPIDYVVMTSDVPGVFNLGGDLAVFSQLIRNHQKETLMAYAMDCIDALYTNHTNMNSDVTTIALVKGDALGGGFEAALSNDYIVAEKGSKLGFPEALFNIFPGMGAYSFLARRIAPALAERMINSANLYSAEELYDMGVVDMLAEPGEGDQALVSFVRKHKRNSITRKSMLTLRDKINPVSYKELKEIGLLWVDAAMSIEEKDLRMMERLVNAQSRKLRRQ